MNRQEATALLSRAKHALSDLGMFVEAGQAEDAELRLNFRMNSEDARAYAEFVFPSEPKRRQAMIDIYPERSVRAIRFIADVLREFDDTSSDP